MNHAQKIDPITTLDKLDPHEEPSEIAEFFKDSTVLITGATGFLGKLYLEKLLRSTEVKKIFILVRSKKGQDAQKRIEEICNGPCFELLRREKPNFQQKIIIVNGDLVQPNLGFSEEDIGKFKEEVNSIIHCAATVRFDEKISIATNINIRPVRDLLEIAKQMKKLKSMLFVSTAFSNSIRYFIDEKVYDPPITADKIMTLITCLEEETLNAITPNLLGEHVNSYVFTKSIAESLVAAESKTLPVSIIRPSAIVGSVREPIAGYVDNMYGVNGVAIGAIEGFIRSVYGNPNNFAEIIPVDYVVNCGLAIMWNTARLRNLNNETKSENAVQVYNSVSSPENLLTWKGFQSLLKKHSKGMQICVWYYLLIFWPNAFYHRVAIVFLHLIPAYLVDLFAILTGNEPKMVKAYKKINKFIEVISGFAMKYWEFNNQNVQNLWESLNMTDQKRFEFNIKKVDWNLYFPIYLKGIQKYVLNKPL